MNAGASGLADKLELRADSRPRAAATLRPLTRRVLLAMMITRRASRAGGSCPRPAGPHVPRERGDRGARVAEDHQALRSHGGHRDGGRVQARRSDPL